MNRYCHILLVAFSTITLAACSSGGTTSALGTNDLTGSLLLDATWRAGAEGARHFFDRRPRRGPERYDAKGMTGLVHPISDALPNPSLTPGALNPAVSQADIDETICVRGYSRSIRPPENYTERLKREQIREYGYKDHKLWHYEEDHLVALSAGGSPTSPENLWPQPHDVVGGWGSFAKDRLETRLHWLVCHRGIPLATAQRALASDWIAAYQRYIGPTPDNHKLHWDRG